MQHRGADTTGTAEAAAGSGPATGEPGFADAMAELEQILSRLESDHLDVDHLAADVRRAGELIKACRARIAHTKVEIEEIVAGIDTDAGEAG